MIRTWLDVCNNEHGDHCNAPIPRPHELPHAPAWLIDVYTSCIKKAPPEDQYVALSYVWEDPSLRDSCTMLQKDNLEIY
jgi:hypothetical protein